MKRGKKKWSIILLFLICFGLPHMVARADTTGAIIVHTLDSANKTSSVEGAQITLYFVGIPSNGQGSNYQKTEAFEGFVSSLSWGNSSECNQLAQELYSFATVQKVQGASEITSSNGIAKFEQLSEGLYLVAQTGGINQVVNHASFTPYLIELPLYDSGNTVYQVDTYPKVDTLPIPTQSAQIGGGGDIPINPPKETPTITPTKKPATATESIEDEDIPEGDVEATKPTKKPTTVIEEQSTPQGGKLPQTGMIQWPIPVLIISGGFMILLGYLDVHIKGKNEKKNKKTKS